MNNHCHFLYLYIEPPANYYSRSRHRSPLDVAKNDNTAWQTQDIISRPHLPQFTLEHTTEDIVNKTMKRINPHKAQDIYKITPAIIRDLTAFLAPTLTSIFNIAISEGIYPDPLKLTKVIELYKNDDKTDPKNYRPISLLPIIAKLNTGNISISRSTETYQARYATLWNNLPLELRREKNRKKFKTLLKHYLQSQQDLIQ